MIHTQIEVIHECYFNSFSQDFNNIFQKLNHILQVIILKNNNEIKF